jgi:hypothetical protein
MLRMSISQQKNYGTYKEKAKFMAHSLDKKHPWGSPEDNGIDICYINYP